MGLAFQIRDDILDVTSTDEELGKPVNSDEKNHKVTYVTLRGLRGRSRCGAISGRLSGCWMDFLRKMNFCVCWLALVYRRK